MKIINFTFACFALLTVDAYAATNKITLPTPDILNNSQQLIVVTTASWDALQGRLQEFSRNSAKEAWQAKGQPWEVVVGKNGLGWAADLQHYQPVGPIKKEGDKKAPAGAFKLGSAFGFAAVPDAQSKLSYIPVTPTLECVDDAKSKYYGKVIDNITVATKDWSSSEIMSQHPDAYHQGIIVEYNTDGKLLQGGSCIFMHIKAAADQNGTYGCTAMPPENLILLSNWLNPKANPVLVQLPKQQYQQLQKAWGLPELY